jgi:hypothetical protein
LKGDGDEERGEGKTTGFRKDARGEDRGAAYLGLGHVVGARLVGQPGMKHVVVRGGGVASVAALRAVARDTVDEHLRRQLQ